MSPNSSNVHTSAHLALQVTLDKCSDTTETFQTDKTVRMDLREKHQVKEAQRQQVQKMLLSVKRSHQVAGRKLLWPQHTWGCDRRSGQKERILGAGVCCTESK